MFSKFELTNNGRDLLNRVIAEKKTLKFTKFQLGKGDYEGDKKELSQLVDKFDEFNITQTNVLADGITNIRGFYDNRNLSVASKLTEIGIMAQLGDDSLTEVLFSYSNQPSTDAETVPAKESYFSRTFSVINKTDNVTSVTFDLTIRQDKYNFGTLAEMKSADYLDVGDKVTLWGETELGDTPFRIYIITDEVQDIQLINTLYAKEYFAVTNDLQNVNKNSVLNAEIVKKLAESNQGLKFDTILNIDDVGTKREGYCYMFEGDIYKCIKQTEATTPESANFQPISNNKLSDRLDNLRELEYISGIRNVNTLETNALITAITWSSSLPENLPADCGLYGVLLQFNITYRTPQIAITTNGMWCRIKSPEWNPWLRVG